MSENTPLLPPKKTDHTVFLRVAHSPHSFISQKTLRSLRGLIACYMLGAFAAKVYYDLKIVDHGLRAVFEVSNLSWLLLTLYEVVGFVWTHMHLYYPRLQNDPESFQKKFKQFLSPGRRTPSRMKRLLFCFFYNGAMVLNPLVCIIHWSAILPHKQTNLSDMFGHNPYETWVIVNFFIINTAITLFEVFFLSSIRCDQVSYFSQVPETGLNHWQPILLHIVWGALTALLLTGWLYFGHWVTGEYIYFFLDLGKYKWQEVCAMEVAFVSLLEIVFLVNHFIIMARQSMTRKQQAKKRARQRLPQ